MAIKERGLVVDPKAQVAERLLKRLGVAIKTFGLYPRRHPVATEALESLLRAIRPYFESHGPFVTRITRQSLVVDDIPLEGEAASTLALHLYTRKLAVLTILPAISDQELAAFLSVVGMDRPSLEAAGGIEHLLWQSGVGNVQVIEMTLDQEQDVEALGLSAFLALIGRGRLAPGEREAVIDILYSPDHTARLLLNVYLMSAEVFAGISPEEQVQHAYQAVRTLDRVILDQPLEGQPHLYTNLSEALLLVEEPLGPALARTVVGRAGDDASAKFLLSHISIDQLADLIARVVSGGDPAGLVVTLLRVLALPERKTEALLSVLETRLRPEGAGPTWLHDALRSYLRRPAEERQSEVPSEFVFDDSLIVINKEELGQQLKEAKAIDEAGTTREVIVTLVDVLREETEEGELLDVAEALAGYLTWMVDHQEFPLLATVLDRLRRIATPADGPRATMAAEIVKRVTEHPLLDQLLAALWASRDTPVEQQVQTCLQVLAGDAVIPLVRVLGGEPRSGMRAVLCDLLVSIGCDEADALGSFVSDERWYLVRNIANILGRLQNPEVVPYLGRVIEHPEYRVRREVADALARVGTEEAQALLVRLLDDADQRIELRAVQALNAWGVRRALPRLLAIVRTGDPFHRLFALKAAALEALERLGAPEAVPVLQRIARTPFALGKRRRELRALARRALAAAEGRPPEAETDRPTAQTL